MSARKVHDTGNIYDLAGGLLNLENLPSPETVRWVMQRKATIIAAVRGGLLSLEDACERYQISMEEFLSWKSALDRFGPVGLRATHARRSRTAVHRSGKHRCEP